MSLGGLLHHVNDKGIEGEVEGLIWAVLSSVEFGLELLESSVSDGPRLDLAAESLIGLTAREDIPYLTILENGLANSGVCPLSHAASSTVKVELCTDLGSCRTRHDNH